MFLFFLIAVGGCSKREEFTDPHGTTEKSTIETGLDPQGTEESNPIAAVTEPAVQPDDAKISSSQPKTEFRFRTIGRDSGFDFIRNDDMHGQKRIMEVNGGGVALLDIDQDGWMDVFMTNGCRLPLVRGDADSPGKLFRNLGGMRFNDISGISKLVQLGFCCGCAVADANHDGFEDLFITGVAGSQFWFNNGDGTFGENVALNKMLSGPWGSSAAFADFNRDNNIDLYVANYLRESPADPRLCPQPESPTGYVGCTPAMFNGVPDTLLLSDGTGGYLDASKQAGLLELPGKALGVVVGDFGGVFGPEIYIANDGQPNYLLSVELAEPIAGDIRGVRCVDLAVSANVAINYQGSAQAGMGIAAVDVDRDGARDLFLTHFYGDTNTLYLNRTISGVRFFEDATRASKLGLPSLNKLGFGVAAPDVDNNGWPDLMVANGHIEDRTWFDSNQPYRMTPQLFENDKNGTFRDVSTASGPYFLNPTLGRGVASGDLDRDGRTDLVVSHQLEPSVILKNETPPAGRSMIIRLYGTTDTRTPIGAKVRIEGTSPLMQEELLGGGSYQAANANEIHFGGLEDRDYDLHVIWPNGQTEICYGLHPGAWILRQNSAVFIMKF